MNKTVVTGCLLSECTDSIFLHYLQFGENLSRQTKGTSSKLFDWKDNQRKNVLISIIEKRTKGTFSKLFDRKDNKRILRESYWLISCQKVPLAT